MASSNKWFKAGDKDVKGNELIYATKTCVVVRTPDDKYYVGPNDSFPPNMIRDLGQFDNVVTWLKEYSKRAQKILGVLETRSAAHQFAMTNYRQTKFHHKNYNGREEGEKVRFVATPDERTSAITKHIPVFDPSTLDTRTVEQPPAVEVTGHELLPVEQRAALALAAKGETGLAEELLLASNKKGL